MHMEDGSNGTEDGMDEHMPPIEDGRQGVVIETTSSGNVWLRGDSGGVELKAGWNRRWGKWKQLHHHHRCGWDDGGWGGGWGNQPRQVDDGVVAGFGHNW